MNKLIGVISSEGELSGEVKDNLLNIAVEIQGTGLRGEKGEDGYTPIKGIDYFDGIDGKDGKDGYTPIKGIDYFDGEKGPRGSMGTTNYNLLENLPSIQSIELIGNRTFEDLGIIPISQEELVNIL